MIAYFPALRVATKPIVPRANPNYAYSGAQCRTTRDHQCPLDVEHHMLRDGAHRINGHQVPIPTTAVTARSASPLRATSYVFGAPVGGESPWAYKSYTHWHIVHVNPSTVPARDANIPRTWWPSPSARRPPSGSMPRLSHANEDNVTKDRTSAITQQRDEAIARARDIEIAAAEPAHGWQRRPKPSYCSSNKRPTRTQARSGTRYAANSRLWILVLWWKSQSFKSIAVVWSLTTPIARRILPNICYQP